MNCNDLENLLPVYLEGDLPGDAKVRVDEHLERCADCRKALDFYRELESSLVERRVLRPSPGRVAARVAERLGIRARRPAFNTWVGVPGILSAALILFGVVMLFIRNPVKEFFVRYEDGLSIRLSPKLGEWVTQISQIGGGGDWVLLTVYGGVFALIMLTGSWMVLKFVRE
ncbi:MAG: zf-HC2 domain-containing protein [Candidatus Latescibacterota bacterium]|nr:MAG: zf-HC2 domain-containing protein [Candidatus Latescibacterota bacterium]